MYISFNDGELWQPFQLNLPVVPITDLTIKDNDLIVATQGRGLWILDDLTTLHQLNKETIDKDVVLFDQRDSYRITAGTGGGNTGENPPPGAVIDFWLKEKTDSTKAMIEILDANKMSIMTFKNDASKDELKDNLSLQKLEVKEGLNRFAWNLSYPNAKGFPGLIMWGGSLRGPLAVPGTYYAKVTIDSVSQEKPFKVLAIPTYSCTVDDYKQQFDFVLEVRDKLTETHECILNIRAAKEQLNTIKEKLDPDKNKAILDQIKSISDELDTIEKALYQTKNRSMQDPLNYPIRLNDKLGAVAGIVASSDAKPTDQSIVVKNELTAAINKQLDAFKKIETEEIPALNNMIWEAKIPAVIFDK